MRHFGCKDVGLPRKELEALLSDIENNGHTSYLEVVSESDEATLASARAAAEIQPDYLIGGTVASAGNHRRHRDQVLPVCRTGRGPSGLLRGSIQEIADYARRAEALGLDGVNLLAYRYDGDVEALVDAVVSNTSLPVIAAGSVDSAERIRALARHGAWAFTIGTAALDGVLLPEEPLQAQLELALEAAAG